MSGLGGGPFRADGVQQARPFRAAIAIVALVVISRFCHLRTLWVEEAYPMAGALQVLDGQLPYRDFWFDKPPLLPLFYALIGAQAGWPLRLLDIAFVLACCYFAYLLARELWHPRAGLYAAGLMAFFLTFDHHSVVLAIAPDLFLLLPHLAAVYLAQRQQAFAAGLVCAVGIAANLKGVFLIPVCLLFAPTRAVALLAGCAPAALLLLSPGFREQALAWGQLYSANTFLENPLAAGLARTGAWTCFHAALLAAVGRRMERKFLLWLLLMAVTVTLGWRFFPRYYFALLPPLVLLAARGFAEAKGRWRLALLALLLAPLVRFGPRYAQVALGQPWGDLALYEDCRRTVGQMPAARSVFVWGYRPEINVLAGAPSRDFYIESQPLTGVFADRHLSSVAGSAAPRAPRGPLQSEYVVDGLGPLNPALAIPPPYLENHKMAGRTATTVIYRRVAGATGAGAASAAPGPAR